MGKQEREFVSLQHNYKMQVSFFLILASVGAVTCASLIKTSSQTPLIQVHKDYAETVRKALNKSSIIPEVLDDFSPKCFFTAYYSKNSGKTHKGAVDLGNEFKPKQTKERPGLLIHCPETLKTPVWWLRLRTRMPRVERIRSGQRCAIGSTSYPHTSQAPLKNPSNSPFPVLTIQTPISSSINHLAHHQRQATTATS